MGDREIRGSCLCGEVRYAIPAESGNFQYCHCSRCRKTGGGAHAAIILLPAEQLRWLEGEDHIGRYVHESAKRFCNAFCRNCGSKLPWVTPDGRWAIVSAGTLDEDPGARPVRNIFWGSRAPWYVPPEQLDTFDELPTKS